MKKTIERFLVKEDLTIKESMRQMGKVGERILFVVNGHNKLLGSLTDGDIRRWVLANGSLNAKISKTYNKKPFTVNKPYDIKHVRQIMLEQKIGWIPVIDNQGAIRDVLLWEQIFGDGENFPKEKIGVPVMIMAGGKGTRLDPFTKVLPKPLIPIGDKTIIEIIMNRFEQYGVDEFFISTNHRSRMIRAYFEEVNTPYNIHYVEEQKPLGTAGSLRLIKDKIKDSLFVSNCDIIIDGNYHEILHFHKTKNYDITMVGCFRHFTIPYGVCTIENGGQLTHIEEKPEHDYLVNTGMYVIRKRILNLIPKDKPFDITDLIEKVREKGGLVGVYPIDEKSWIDIGQWEEYHKAVKLLGVGSS